MGITGQLHATAALSADPSGSVNMRLGEPHSRSGRFDPPRPPNEPLALSHDVCHPVRSHVTTLTELPRLPCTAVLLSV